MRHTITDAKVKTRTQERVSDATRAEDTIVSGIMTIGGTVAFLIGLWAAACVVGGLIAAGGPIQFVKSWFLAVSGG